MQQRGTGREAPEHGAIDGYERRRILARLGARLERIHRRLEAERVATEIDRQPDREHAVTEGERELVTA